MSIKTASRVLILVFLSLTILLSCASLSPVDSARESPVSFAVIEEVKPQWQPFAENIGYFHGTITEPKLEFWALRIELVSPGTRIVVRGGASRDGTDTLSTKVSSFVRNNELIAGINAVPFDILSAEEGRPIRNIGIVISGGQLIAPANPNYDALVIYNNGRAGVVNQAVIHSTENIENAVGGFYQILADGDPTERAFTRKERHPRSTAGVSANGERLYLLVIDGRRSDSIGSTEEETALLLRALGSWDGINLDGGGSSALALRYTDGNVRAANTPIHNGIPGMERAVAGCIGISLSRER